MSVCSSFCSPAGREGVSRQPKGCWQGAQHGCGQQKLFPLPKQKKPRALLLPSISPQRATCREGTAQQEDCGCLLLHPTAIAPETGTAWGGRLWPRWVWEACDSKQDLSCHVTQEEQVGGTSPASPLSGSSSPSLTPLAQAQPVPSSLFSCPVSLCPAQSRVNVSWSSEKY